MFAGTGQLLSESESINLYSSVYNSMSDVFRNIKPVAGNKLYLIASDSELQLHSVKWQKGKVSVIYM